MRKQSMFRQFMVIGSGAIINMLVGLFTTPLITRLVDPEQYGQATIFGTYANIALMVLSLGMDQALVRYFYKEEGLRYQKKLLWCCWTIPAILATLVFSLWSFFGVKSNFILVNEMFYLFILYVFVLILNRFAILLLRLTKKTNVYSALNVLQKLAYVCMALSAIKIIQGDYYRLLVVANISAYFIVTVIAMFAERRLWNPFGIRGNLTVSISEMVKYGFPLMVANGIYMIFQAIDKLSLNYFCSYSDVGIYSSAMSLMSVIAIVSSTFNTIWAPASVEHYEKEQDDKSFYVKGNQYITVIMFTFGLTLMLCKDIIVLLLGEKYREASYILPFLILQPIMYTISETTVVGIYFKKKSYASLIISAVSCIVNLAGNFLLIPILGPKGAAVSTGFSYIVFFVLRTCFSNLYYYVNYGLCRFAIITVITVGFSTYNTFFTFNILTVVLYILAILLLFILYKKSIIELVDIGISRIKNMKQKKD